jgi:hypothetical protein
MSNLQAADNNIAAIRVAAPQRHLWARWCRSDFFSITLSQINSLSVIPVAEAIHTHTMGKNSLDSLDIDDQEALEGKAQREEAMLLHL